MTELRIWTARQTIKVAAPPARVYQLLAHVDRWPTLFDSLVAVEHLGYEETSERVRFWKRTDSGLHCWTSVRELNPKRLQVRFRQIDFPAPLASLGGLWLVVPKGPNSVIALDHYYRVQGDDPVAAAQVERDINTNSAVMLSALRHTAEVADLVETGSPAEGEAAA